jgi:hypothetical protein
MNDNIFSGHYKSIQIIYIAVFLGQVVSFVIALILVENGIINPVQSADGLFKIMIPAVGIGAMFAANRNYNKNITGVNKNDVLIIKLTKYRSSKIIQWAIIEASSFLSLLGFILTSDYLYVIVFLFMLGFIILIRPSKEQIRKDLNISDT